MAAERGYLGNMSTAINARLLIPISLAQGPETEDHQMEESEGIDNVLS